MADIIRSKKNHVGATVCPPSLNDGKSNRSADKSMPVRNSCRQAIARHPVTMVSSARKNSLEYFQSLSEKPLSGSSDISRPSLPRPFPI
jgi:hypothetical protein